MLLRPFNDLTILMKLIPKSMFMHGINLLSVDYG